MTEEVIYSGEKTNMDPQLDRLCKQGDDAKNWTQKIMKDTEAVLVPNPGMQSLSTASIVKIFPPFLV